MPSLSTIPSRSDHLHHHVQPGQCAVLDSSVMRAMRNETIRLRSYILLLAALRGVHAGMDAHLPDLPLRLPIAPLRRLPALDADLRTWDPHFIMTVPHEEPRMATMDALSLVGVLFALESLRHATVDVASSLARAFALPADARVGLSYHGTADPLAWHKCVEAVNRLPLTPAQDDLVAEGALVGTELLLACHQGIEL